MSRHDFLEPATIVAIGAIFLFLIQIGINYQVRATIRSSSFRPRPVTANIAVLFVATTVLLAGPAAADDWDRCYLGSGDVAFAACSRAIESGNYEGQDIAILYNNRGIEYWRKGDIDRAIEDYNHAIKSNPQYAKALNNRGAAYYDKKDYGHAMADFSEAIALNPKYPAAYFSRGLAHLYGGSLAKAQFDFKQASDLNPRYAYYSLWHDITERRLNIPSHLAQAATQIDMKAWPAPVVLLFLGELTPSALLAAAEDTDPKTMRGQLCEANFYSGELALLQGAKDDAIRLFQLAARNCSKTFFEWEGATAELKALGITP
jgi:lipoprotein NlpI